MTHTRNLEDEFKTSKEAVTQVMPMGSPAGHLVTKETKDFKSDQINLASSARRHIEAPSEQRLSKSRYFRERKIDNLSLLEGKIKLLNNSSGISARKKLLLDKVHELIISIEKDLPDLPLSAKEDKFKAKAINAAIQYLRRQLTAGRWEWWNNAAGLENIYDFLQKIKSASGIDDLNIHLQVMIERGKTIRNEFQPLLDDVDSNKALKVLNR